MTLHPLTLQAGSSKVVFRKLVNFVQTTPIVPSGALGLRLRSDQMGRREGGVAEAGLGRRNPQRQIRPGKCEQCQLFAEFYQNVGRDLEVIYCK